MSLLTRNFALFRLAVFSATVAAYLLFIISSLLSLDPIELTELGSAWSPDDIRIGTARKKNSLCLPLWGSRSTVTFILLTISLPSFSHFISLPATATSPFLLYHFLTFLVLNISLFYSARFYLFYYSCASSLNVLVIVINVPFLSLVSA